jgi:hypothetical protein
VCDGALGEGAQHAARNGWRGQPRTDSQEDWCAFWVALRQRQHAGSPLTCVCLRGILHEGQPVVHTQVDDYRRRQPAAEVPYARRGGSLTLGWERNHKTTRACAHTQAESILDRAHALEGPSGLPPSVLPTMVCITPGEKGVASCSSPIADQAWR